MCPTDGEGKACFFELIAAQGLALSGERDFGAAAAKPSAGMAKGATLEMSNSRARHIVGVVQMCW
ncbi:MAG TPA: hypothetical protein DCQ94_19605 [Nitrospira sp.]|nr:hypothetical protein [Nitrospira sp.]